jgi:hypothetical protein
MNIIKAKPPNFERIAAVFPAARDKGVLFCYGTDLFNPDGIRVTPYLIAHE